MLFVIATFESVAILICQPMRHFFSVLFLFLWAHIAMSATVAVDGIYYELSEADGTAAVTFRPYEGVSSDGWMYYSADQLYVGDVVVPDSVCYGGVCFRVVRLADNAFAGSRQMSTLSLPASVVSVGSGLFSLCTGLETISVAEGNPVFTDIDGVMYKKSPLEIFFVPRAISGNLTLPDGLTEIPSSAFQNCVFLDGITIPNSVTAIRDGAFDGCSSLAEVNFGTGLTTIGRNAFSKCKYLQIIDFSSTLLTSIGAMAFDGCTDLSLVYLGNRLQTIGISAFYDCALFALALPASLTSIGDKAFYGCTNLSTIQNNSALTLALGDASNGYVAYYASEIIVPTEVPLVGQDGVKVSLLRGGAIVVCGAEGRRFSVMDLSGRLVSQGVCGSAEHILSLGAYGVFTLQVGASCSKIFVR